MAIIGRSESGFLVDHEKSISEAVSALSVVCKEGLFALFEPYFRSAAENTDGTRKRKRKKSAKAEPTDEDIEAAVYRQKVRQTIATGVESLVRIGFDKGHFCFRDHENTGRDIVMSDQNLSSEKDLLGRMISHHDDKPTVLSISGQQYILPASCSFLMSDASNLKPLVDHAQQSGLYDLVVLDPPWFNKSAKRGSKYSFMSMWQIKSLPVPQLLAPGALVGIWVTNKQKYLRFTKSELFPHWSVELVAEWYWVKVTRRGELVTDLDSPHKKPYEPLLIGRFRPKMDDFRTTTLKSAKEFESNNDIMRREPDNTSSPQMKRKKISKCYNFDKTEHSCSCDKDRNVTAMIPEWPSSISTPICKSVIDLNHAEYHKNKTDQPDNLLKKVASQSTDKHCLNGQKLLRINKEAPMDNTTILTDDDERTLQNSTGEYASKWNSETCTGLNVERCGRDDRLATNQTGAVSESTREACDVLPYHQVICSVPCKIHSRKPPLSEILTQYVPAKSLCLEMFARNLTPHWTSWGNEVLKFQSMEYFEQLAPKEEEKLNLNTE